MEEDEINLELAVDTFERVAEEALETGYRFLYGSEEGDDRRPDFTTEMNPRYRDLGRHDLVREKGEIPDEVNEYLMDDNLYYLWNRVETMLEKRKSNLREEILNPEVDTAKYKPGENTLEEKYNQVTKLERRYQDIDTSLRNFNQVFSEIYGFDMNEERDFVALKHPDLTFHNIGMRKLEGK
ncbi:MAG: hypothetical protein ABEJ95_06025 [Candidatus Nanohalobium sp.]